MLCLTGIGMDWVPPCVPCQSKIVPLKARLYLAVSQSMVPKGPKGYSYRWTIRRLSGLQNENSLGP